MRVSVVLCVEVCAVVERCESDVCCGGVVSCWHDVVWCIAVCSVGSRGTSVVVWSMMWSGVCSVTCVVQ